MSEEALEKAWSNHSILWKENVWVYPVISRRAGGISIGINLNPDKHCTFDCAYCQVDRSVPGLSLKNDVIEIEKELDKIISAYEKNGLADFVSFQNVEAEKRMIKDICISGDGESLCDDAPQARRTFPVSTTAYAHYKRNSFGPRKCAKRAENFNGKTRRNLGKARCGHRKLV